MRMFSITATVMASCEVQVLVGNVAPTPVCTVGVVGYSEYTYYEMLLYANTIKPHSDQFRTGDPQISFSLV